MSKYVFRIFFKFEYIIKRFDQNKFYYLNISLYTITFKNLYKYFGMPLLTNSYNLIFVLLSDIVNEYKIVKYPNKKNPGP